MKKQLFIGVDGGASKCLLRLEDEAGKCLGEGAGGPANIRISVDQAWGSTLAAFEQALSQAGISLNTLNDYAVHAGMGLAGIEIAEAKSAFLSYAHPFASLHVTSDAHVACSGAHAGKDGAIIIVGTGTVGFKQINGEVTKVAGWGFPHDDLGSGAWIGLEAIKLTIQTCDGRESPSQLTNHIMRHFQQDREALITWANQATSTQFAEIAPIVIEHAQQHQMEATQILKRAALEVERIWLALQKTDGIVPCSLMGGIAPFVENYLSNTVKNALKPAKSTPVEGAVHLARQYADLGVLA